MNLPGSPVSSKSAAVPCVLCPPAFIDSPWLSPNSFSAYLFFFHRPVQSFQAWNRGLVTQIDEPLGRRTTRQWSRNRIYGYDNANPYVQSESVTLPALSGVPSAKTIRKDFAYDRNGNLTQLTEFDFNNVAARTTIHRYLFPVEAGTDTTVTNYTGPNLYAYWLPLTSGRAINARFSTEVRAGNSSGTLAAYRESSFDSHWNVTESRAWDNTRGSTPSPGASVPAQTPVASLTALNSVATQAQFANDQSVFQNGNVTASFDAKNNRTSLAYGVINGCAGSNPSLTNLYPTQRVEAAGTSAARTFELFYDCNTGVVTSDRDVDNNVTSTTTYDGLGRPLVRTEAGIRSSSQSYYDSAYITVAKQDLTTLGDGKLVTVTHSDDLGRPYLTRSTPDTGAIPAWDDSSPESTGIVIKRLSKPACPALNQPLTCTADTSRYEAVSNPYISGQPIGFGWSRSRIDVLGRVQDVTTYSATAASMLPPPWGALGNPGTAITGVTQYAYDGDLTTITDPAGKARAIKVDALGRTVEVIEDPAGLNYSTTYTYDVLDNLTNVNQGTKLRTFGYSTLSRLLTTTNPESGQIAYTYDLNGNLLTKVHSGSVTTTMSAYDPLNRITGKSYSDSTPSVSYVYDTCTYGRGRLCAVNSTASSMNTTYDVLGRAASSTQTTSSISYPFSYQYNLAGALKSVDYPSATLNPAQPLKVSYAFNQAGRVTSVRKGDSQSTDTYLSAATYWPNGGPQTLSMGNGLYEVTAIGPQQQVAYISASLSGTTLWRTDLTYSSTANNGNILSQSINGSHGGVPVYFTQTYEYDALNRLRSVLDSGAGAPVDSKTQVFVYDRYGNRALKDHSVNPGGGVVATADTAAAVEAAFPDNKLNNCCNAAGDTTSLNGATITYDGEHRVSLVDYTSGPPTPTAVKLRYFYDGDGRRVRSEKESGGTIVSSTSFIYDAFGQLMAEYTTPAPTGLGRQYLTQDHLGSTRLVTTANGNVYSRHDYLPFGEEIARGTYAYGPSPLSLKFAGKEREGETGLDYFGARYLSAGYGRFTSPDISLLDQHPLDPQSWNLSAYVRNRPLSMIDPTGHCSIKPGATAATDDPGEPCVAAGASSISVTADVSKPRTQGENLEFLVYWWTGALPGGIDYGPNDGATKDLQNTPTVKAQRLQYIKDGCPTSRDISQGHFSAYGRVVGGYVTGSPNNTENQVGGFSGSISNPNTGTITYRVVNNAGYSSFVGQTTWGPWIGQQPNAWDNPNGAAGPRHNVIQTFTWTEQNPCDMH